MKNRSNPLLSLFLLITLLVAMAVFDLIRQSPKTLSRDSSFRNERVGLIGKALIHDSRNMGNLGSIKRTYQKGYYMQSTEMTLPNAEEGEYQSWLLDERSDSDIKYINTGKVVKMPDGKYFGYFESSMDLSNFTLVLITAKGDSPESLGPGEEIASAQFIDISEL